ncbi:hypothetical protein [Salinibacterium sp. PAMC 21357]|uniref:hypothetical protein n=1 Tax=Salinibacterium sp. PAMC 21357 TaxID=1112215 RepID=UPI00028855F5|nr:hypothetical protein [Salinibacterium sp. PAMC 21357]
MKIQKLAASAVSAALLVLLSGCTSWIPYPEPTVLETSPPRVTALSVTSAEYIAKNFRWDELSVTNPEDLTATYCGGNFFVGDCKQFYSSDEVVIITYETPADNATLLAEIEASDLTLEEQGYHFSPDGAIVLSTGGRGLSTELQAKYAESLERLIAQF